MKNRLVKMALRNVTRNRKRTTITAFAVTLGVLVVIVAKGFINGMEQNIIEGATERLTGQLQISRTAYVDSGEARPLKYSMNYNEITTFLKDKPDVLNSSGRIIFGAMLSTGDLTLNAAVTAIDPKREEKVCELINRADKGKPLTDDDESGILISSQLAHDLHTGVGDILTIVTNTRYGAMNATDLEVRGIFSQSGQQAAKTVYMNLKAAQELLQMEGQVTEAVIDGRGPVDDKKLLTLKQELNERLSEAGYTVRTWNEVAPSLNDALARMDGVLILITLILFTIVITGVINTMLMSVFERTKEIGTMMAIGVRRRKIVGMFMYESIFISSIGAFVGLGLAVAILAIADKAGVVSGVGQGQLGAGHMHPYITLGYAVLSIAVAISGALLAAVYPARKASELKPAEALRS